MTQEVQKKKPSKFIIIGLIALVVIGIGATLYIKGANYETSDNAQLYGDLVPIRSSVTAFIKDVRFKDNQLVKKGDTLILFDADELKAKVTQAEAALDNANANLLAVQNKASASVENATASVETVASNQQSIVGAKVKLDKAQKDLDRVIELQKIKAATQEQFDNAQANLQIAKSDYERTINQQQSSSSSSLGLKAQANADQNQIDLAKAQIKQREAELALAKKQLSYATVLAPCNGVVTKRAIQLGQYVSTGQSLCVVIDDENYWISANFKETQLRKLKIGN